MESDCDYVFKILVLGDSGIGKTSLVNRYGRNKEPVKEHMATIGVDFVIKTIKLEIGGIERTVKLQLWDTAGQERFNAISRNYFRGCHGIALVFALNSPESFGRVNYWLSELKLEHIDAKCILIGNKCDLQPHAISGSQIRTYCQNCDYDMEYIEASALNGTGVEEAFLKLANTLAKTLADSKLNSDTQKPNFVYTTLSDSKQEPETKRACCGGTH